MGKQADVIEGALQAIEGLFGGVEQEQPAWVKSSKTHTECVADGAACAGDEDGGVAELAECCIGWRGQSRPSQEAVPVDRVGW